jgi:hypothetical protein
MASSILAGLVVLMIGDSHLTYQGSLVTTLQDLLVHQGASVTSYGACGAPASVWAYSGSATCGTGQRSQFGPIKLDHDSAAPVPSVTSLIDATHPNLIIISLGDTMAYYTAPTMPVDKVEADIKSLTTKLAEANTPCIWVGPGWGTEGGPSFKTNARVQQMSQLLATSVAPCRYIDSTALSRPGEWPTFDGMHYTVPGYQKWAFAIDAAVLKLVPHPAS